ncbi:uncharacterized protein EDB91DRAFT_96360 [Suillus paluster]|uniref:uncharacterized protein n=1 Tax=Suillus paluster TaxID=48578 RepID=UPI001B870A48|nr:uncharacterized protein EDB91DRAFT_96360 [Suillus paluster]KAG1725273.1 hypothetical protein EDB91DRAFT_96360 [Suillus paluster]
MEQAHNYWHNHWQVLGSYHLYEPTTPECVSILAKEFGHAQFGDEILREIAEETRTRKAQSFSEFSVRFSEKSPRTVLKIRLLPGHLDERCARRRTNSDTPLSLEKSVASASRRRDRQCLTWLNRFSFGPSTFIGTIQVVRHKGRTRGLLWNPELWVI